MAENFEPIHLGISFPASISLELLLKKCTEEYPCQFFSQPLRESSGEFITYPLSETESIFTVSQAMIGVSRSSEEKECLEDFEWAAHLCLKQIILDENDILSGKSNSKINGRDNVLESIKFVRKIKMIFRRVSSFKGEIWIPFDCNENNFKKWLEIHKFLPLKWRVFPIIRIGEENNVEELKTWLGCNVRCFSISIDMVEKESENIKNIITYLLTRRANILLEINNKNEKLNEIEEQKIKNSMELIIKLRREFCVLDENQLRMRSYRDYIQIPIQPQNEYLSSTTYAVFEIDSVKYSFYEEAIFKAFDKILQKENLPNILIVGPGRGPLIDLCLKASIAKGKKIQIFAVERNPCAFITLKHIQKTKTEWKFVKLVNADARKWRPGSIKFDIILSELLGSFGDNELAPEIIFEVEELIKENGVIIPQSYTSFLQPVFSQTVWGKLKHKRTVSQNCTKSQTDGFSENIKEANFETPYIVSLFDYNILDAPQSCFNFSHNSLENKVKRDISESKREKTISFTSNSDSVIHGFTGYFEAVLFEDVKISTNPLENTEGMNSWFPTFLPISRPIDVKKGEEIGLVMWRERENERVWYEWCLLQPRNTKIHNIGGSSYSMELGK